MYLHWKQTTGNNPSRNAYNLVPTYCHKPLEIVRLFQWILPDVSFLEQKARYASEHTKPYVHNT